MDRDRDEALTKILFYSSFLFSGSGRELAKLDLLFSVKMSLHLEEMRVMEAGTPDIFLDLPLG